MPSNYTRIEIKFPDRDPATPDTPSLLERIDSCRGNVDRAKFIRACVENYLSQVDYWQGHDK